MMKKWFLIYTAFFLYFSYVFSSDSLILGIPPWAGSNSNVYSSYSDFLDYLSENSGKKISLRITVDYEELASETHKGNIDIAILPSSAYVKAKEVFPNLKYMCTPINKSSKKASYSSFIIVRKNGNIKSYKDLKGKYFAFVDEKSSSGYIFPFVHMISKWNINPKIFFKKILFLGSHPNVIEAVYSKKADAGAVSSKTINDFKFREDILIMDSIDNIPFDGVIASPYIDTSLFLSIKKAFLSINSETKTKHGKLVIETFPWGGFCEESDSYYDIIRDTYKIFEAAK